MKERLEWNDLAASRGPSSMWKTPWFKHYSGATLSRKNKKIIGLLQGITISLKYIQQDQRLNDWFWFREFSLEWFTTTENQAEKKNNNSISMKKDKQRNLTAIKIYIMLHLQ